MHIFDRVRASIDAGMDATIVIRNGRPGVLFSDEWEFIPFEDLNYNQEYGYFRVSDFPAIEGDCEPFDPATFDHRRMNPGGGKAGRTWAQKTSRITSYIPYSWADELIRYGKWQADAVRSAVDLALHPTEGETLHIRLEDPLPCAIRRGDGVCNRRALVAYARRYRDPAIPGQWLLQPICPDCLRSAGRQNSVG